MEKLIETLKKNDYTGIIDLQDEYNLEEIILNSRVSPLWYIPKNDSLFNEAIFTLLVEYGADLDNKNNEGQTILMYCIEKGYRIITDMIISNDCNLDLQDKSKMSALHYAVYNLDYELVRLLVTCGIDVTLQDNCGHTATQYLLNKFNHQHVENAAEKRKKCLEILS
jgi:ankyrin repeat protein